MKTLDDRTIVDEETGEVLPADFKQSLNVTDMTGVQMTPLSLGISEHDTRKGKEFCRSIVSQIVKLKLPEHLRKKDELIKLIQLQQSFEEFTLQSMFAVVAQAVKLLNQLTLENDLYDEMGQLNNFKLQAVLATQQHVMSIIQQFNLHIRRLPQAITDMIRDIEYSQVMTIETVDCNHEESSSYGHTTSKPLALIMQEAEAELAQTEEVSDESPVQTSNEQARVNAMAAQMEQTTNIDEEDDTIDL